MIDEDPIVDDEEIDTNLNNIDNGGNDDEFKGISRTYRTNELKKWKPAPVVRENSGKPGEMGKAVKMKSYQLDEMKEKFKENQFNLLASDMIWLNRSLADVRHKEYVALMTIFFNYYDYVTSIFNTFHSHRTVAERKLTQVNCQRHRLSSYFITKHGLRCYGQYGVSSTDRQGHC